jgi:hypothetical protein
VKFRTIYNRVDRNEFTFDEADLRQILREHVVQRLLAKDVNHVGRSIDWTMEVRDAGEDGGPYVVVLTQSFTYDTVEPEKSDV